MLNKINKIAARCSAFSGWKLQAAVVRGPTRAAHRIRFSEPAREVVECLGGTQASSVLVLALAVCPVTGREYLREVEGRLRWWGVTPEEENHLFSILQAIDSLQDAGYPPGG